MCGSELALAVCLVTYTVGHGGTLLALVLFPALTPERIRNDMSELGLEEHAGYGMFWAILWPLFWILALIRVASGRSICD